MAADGTDGYSWIMRPWLFAVLLVSASVQAADIYRWVDATGQVHYSDQWQPGAEKIRIEAAPGFSAPTTRRAASEPGAGTKPAQASALYESLVITSPAQEEVLWNIEGQLQVAVQVSPSLRPGHELLLYLDGKAQEMPPGSTAARLTDVFRGVHTLRVEVLDESGEVLIESDPTTFAVRQTSLLNPSRPRTP